MGAEISYETLLRLKERLLERLALVDAKLEKLCQEHHTGVSVPSSATERLPMCARCKSWLNECMCEAPTDSNDPGLVCGVCRKKYESKSNNSDAMEDTNAA